MLGDDPPVPRQHDPARDRYTEIRRPPGPGQIEHAVKFGVGDDASAAPGQLLGRPLEHLDIPAPPPQQQRGEQAGNRPAYDDCPLARRTYASPR